MYSMVFLFCFTGCIKNDGSISPLIKNNDAKTESLEVVAAQLQYEIVEHIINIESLDVHIDIRYPQVRKNYMVSPQNGDINHDIPQINKILVPAEIEEFYNNMSNVHINDYGVLEYFNPNFDQLIQYTWRANYKYIMGMKNNRFLNLYFSSMSMIRTSNWRYGAVLIDLQSGEKIDPIVFFDTQALREYVGKDYFKTNRDGFDVHSYIQNLNNEQLVYYLQHAFINIDRQLEIYIEYIEEKTVIYADLDSVKGVIRPQYWEHIFE